MIHILLSAAIIAAPSSATEPSGLTLSKRDAQIAKRLTAFIIARHKRPSRKKRVAAYAAILAERIIIEAKRNRIPVTTLAAIGWAESWFWKWCAGTSHEYGVWQLWPYSGALGKAWGKLRREGRIGSHPDRPWKRLGYSQRKKILGDVVVSTALAAIVLRGILWWCKRHHKIHRAKLLGSRRHRYPIDRAAHYNSGKAWPNPGYYGQLRKYSRTLRTALYSRSSPRGAND